MDSSQAQMLLLAKENNFSIIFWDAIISDVSFQHGVFACVTEINTSPCLKCDWIKLHQSISINIRQYPSRDCPRFFFFSQRFSAGFFRALEGRKNSLKKIVSDCFLLYRKKYWISPKPHIEIKTYQKISKDISRVHLSRLLTSTFPKTTFRSFPKTSKKKKRPFKIFFFLGNKNMAVKRNRRKENSLAR